MRRGPSGEPEKERLERVFREYLNDDRYRRRWSRTQPGNAQIEREREHNIKQLLSAAGLWPPKGYRILDVGCGTGGPLARFFEWGASPADLVGVDLLHENVEIARRSHPSIRFFEGEASSLELPDSEFQMVLAFTIFSSILDQGLARRVAQEIDRVLIPRGVLLWYDYRISHPLNPNTKGMSRRAIRKLFPAYEANVRSITLVPQIARRLGPLTQMYPALARIPMLRTHYLGLLSKPG